MKKKWNVVDTVILLLIAAALAVCLLFLRSRGTIGPAATQPMRFTVELTEVRQNTVDMMKVGELVRDGADGTHLGTLVSVESIPYEVSEYSPVLGKYVTYTVPDLLRVYMEVECEGRETEKDMIFGENTFRIGNSLYVKGKGYAGGGYVVGLNRMDGEEVKEQREPSGSTEIEYVLRIEGIRDFSMEALHEGDCVYEKDSGALMGTITAVKSEPYTTVELGPDGNVVVAERPEYHRVWLTMRARCDDTEKSYFIDDKVEFKLGSDIVINTKYNECWASYDTLLSLDGKAVS